MSRVRREEPNVLEQPRAERARLAGWYEEVFGQPRKRTDAQEGVLSHLAAHSGDEEGREENNFRFRSGWDGLSSALAAAQMDGAKSVLRLIKQQLHIAANPPRAPKPKAVTKR